MRINTAVIPSTRPDYTPEQQATWLALHESHKTRARSGKSVVIFLGDSITAGWLTHGAALWEKHFAPLGAVNFGIAGDRTQQVLWRIEHGNLEPLDPRVVVLLLGTNNLTPGLDGGKLMPRNTPEEIAAGIIAVVETLQRKLPRAEILLFGIFPRDDALRSDIATTNAALQEWAASHAVHFADIGAAFLSPNGGVSPDTMPDRLHPNEKGYQLWAQAMQPLLAGLIQAANPSK